MLLLEPFFDFITLMWFKTEPRRSCVPMVLPKEVICLHLNSSDTPSGGKEHTSRFRTLQPSWVWLTWLSKNPVAWSGFISQISPVMKWGSQGQGQGQKKCHQHGRWPVSCASCLVTLPWSWANTALFWSLLGAGERDCLRTRRSGQSARAPQGQRESSGSCWIIRSIGCEMPSVWLLGAV